MAMAPATLPEEVTAVSMKETEGERDAGGWTLPVWMETFVSESEPDLTDVSFYPYSIKNEDPVFVVVGTGMVLIFQYQRSTLLKNKLQPLYIYKDDEINGSIGNKDKNKRSRAVAWARRDDAMPLLCLTGPITTFIKVINPFTGERIQTLVGHGKAINALATSPSHPHILASAADDKNIYLWSLAKAHQEAPCVAVVGGWGHIDRVLSLAWHSTGKWLISGGFDNRVCLWRAPEYPNLQASGLDWVPEVMSVPYFCSSEIHRHPVERVAFLDDSIISHGATESYVSQWRITGFSSSSQSGLLPNKPVFHEETARTRSAWIVADKEQPLYQRLLCFDTQTKTDETMDDPWHLNRRYLDFDVYIPKLRKGKKTGHGHATLAVCKGFEVRFWDFGRMVKWHRESKNLEDGEKLKLPWTKDERSIAEEIERSANGNATDGVEAVNAISTRLGQRLDTQQASPATNVSTPTRIRRTKMKPAKKTVPRTGGVHSEASHIPQSVPSTRTAASFSKAAKKSVRTNSTVSNTSIQNRTINVKNATDVAPDLQGAIQQKDEATLHTAAGVRHEAHNDSQQIEEATELSPTGCTLRGGKSTLQFGVDRHHVCPLCKTRFSKDAHLIRHHATVHSDAWPFECNECGNRFKRKDKFDQHVRDYGHSGVAAAAHNVAVEEKDTSLTMALEPHDYKAEDEDHDNPARKSPPERQTHVDLDGDGGGSDDDTRRTATMRRGRKPNSDGGKRHACPVCSATFSRKEHLGRHNATVHSDEKPFKCDECGSKFARKDNLDQHARAHARGGHVAAPRFVAEEEEGSSASIDFESDEGKAEIEEDVENSVQKPSPGRRFRMAFGGDGAGSDDERSMVRTKYNRFELSATDMRESFSTQASSRQVLPSKAYGSISKPATGEIGNPIDLSPIKVVPARTTTLTNKMMADFKTRTTNIVGNTTLTKPFNSMEEGEDSDFEIINPADFKARVSPAREARESKQSSTNFIDLTSENGSATSSRRSRRPATHQSTERGGSLGNDVEMRDIAATSGLGKKCLTCNRFMTHGDGRQLCCQVCRDMEHGRKKGEEDDEMGGANAVKVCAVCFGTNARKWHDALYGEESTGKCFCDECHDKDYTAKMKKEIEAAATPVVMVCALCGSTVSRSWHLRLHKKPKTENVYCNSCFDRDYRRRMGQESADEPDEEKEEREGEQAPAVLGTPVKKCSLCGCEESNKWHHRLHKQQPTGQLFCSKCHRKDYNRQMGLKSTGGSQDEDAGEGTRDMVAVKVCSLCGSKTSRFWHHCLHNQPRTGQLFCSKCHGKDYRRQMQRPSAADALVEEVTAAGATLEKTKKRARELSPDGSVPEQAKPGSKTLADHMLENALKDVDLMEREVQIEASSPEKIFSSPERWDTSKEKAGSEKAKPKVEGWEKYDMGDAWRGLEAHGVAVGVSSEEVARCVRWSPCGRVLVVVGDFGVVSVYSRA